MKKKVRSSLLFIFSFSVMFMIGYMDSLRSPLIPKIRESFGINYSNVGFIFFAACLGFLISTFFGGMLCDRKGQKSVELFGFLCIITAVVGIFLSPVFGVFLFMMGFLNIGLGSAEMGVNSLVGNLEVKNQAVVMNLIHFFYGVGASVGPRYSGQLMSAGVNWRKAYLFSLFVIVSVFLYLVCLKFPEKPIRGREQSLPVAEVLKNKRVLLFGLALGIYTSCEMGVSNWFVNYLTVIYKMKEIKSSTYLSIFFILFTAGRLIGGLIAEKTGYFNSVLIFMTSSLLLFLGGTLLGGKYLILVSVCGFTYSIVFPTLLSAVIKEFRQSTSVVLGCAITMSSGISMMSNWVMGKLNDILGVHLGFMITAVYIVLELLLVFALKATSYESSRFQEIPQQC